MSASGPYAVGYDPKALKELARLDKPVARRRVIYAIKDADLVVLALRVAHRSVVYRTR